MPPAVRRASAGTIAATNVALLRGLNVGGRNRLTMEALRALFVEAGCAGVRSYIQSGNVLFAAPAALATRLPEALPELILARHGLRTPLVLRSVPELRALTRVNPFLAAGADPRALHVAFLQGPPPAAAAAALDARRSPPDAFALRGRDLFLSLPNGVAGTRLTTDYLDRTLGSSCTLRNWRTVLAIVALADG
jgi:uncharacterized protein (DUF1697 family)